MAFFKRLITGKGSPVPFKRAVTTRDLLRREAQIGGQLFGPVPNGRTRQFFCLDEHSWIWHETWLDESGRQQSLTTRYELRPNGILKAQGSQPYHFVEPEEEKNLIKAIHIYYDQVVKDLYGSVALNTANA